MNEAGNIILPGSSQPIILDIIIQALDEYKRDHGFTRPQCPELDAIETLAYMNNEYLP